METLHFTEKELACSCCGVADMQPDYMERLEQLRVSYGKPMVLSSAYRCPKYNADVSGTGETGPHTTGRAVDVAVRGKDAHRLIKLAMGLGFTGLGIKQKGDGRFVHLDDLGGDLRPGVWSY